MTQNIIPLSFNLPDKLQTIIKCIDFDSLETAIMFKPGTILKMAVKQRILLDCIRYYGVFFKKCGTFISLKLPADVESQIKDHLASFSQELANKSIIRLQLVYGGEMVPIHIDQTRSSSIVCPIQHNRISYTIMYNNNPLLENRRGLQNPVGMVQVESTVVKDRAVLINTDMPHSVNYSKHSFTKADPRVSLTIKFENLKIYDPIFATLF